MNTMFYILGASLAQAIGKEETVCRGLLRLSIMDQVEHLRQTADLAQVVAYMRTMTYQDWRAIIEGAVFSRRLASIGVSNPASVVAQLKQTLVEKQSLLTMAAH